MLTEQNCYYCNREPGNKHYIQSSDREWNEANCYIYNGLDRLDSNIGYVSTNVVPCCKFCNWGKMTQSREEFIEQIKIIYNNLKLKGLI